MEKRRISNLVVYDVPTISYSEENAKRKIQRRLSSGSEWNYFCCDKHRLGNECTGGPSDASLENIFFI